jgi:polysaccharide chain length determinant protein (PEP-CTERM system associated)
MLPGKKYQPEDILRIVKRRLWILLVPVAVIGAGTAVWSRYLPDRFRAETVILVVPQKVPESYVRSTVTTRIEDRLQSLQQQIMSRTRLERVIQDFNLYPEARKSGIMEDIVQRMRLNDIGIQVVRGDAFRISYMGDNPRTVQRVAERLAAMFIEENLREREQQAEGTNQFLEAQLEEARRRLIEQEKKLEDYRRQFAGQLPNQLDSNLQVLQSTQMQVQGVLESINRDRDRRLVLEQQLAELEQQQQAAVDAAASTTAPAGDAANGSPAQQLAAAKQALAVLGARLKPGHPDRMSMERAVRDLEQKVDAADLDAPVSGAAAPAATPGEQVRRRRIDDLRAEIAQLDRQLTNRQNEEQRLRQLTGAYQSRVEAAPTRESEMVELTRDYTTLQSMYTSLLSKKEDSKIAANLERRQIGEQFKLLDQARVPERPFSPDRRRLNQMGLAAGLGVGLLLVGLLEYRDKSFKTDHEVVELLSLPVLAVVPLMQSPGERKWAFRKHVALNFLCGSTVAVGLAVVAYTFIR